MTVSESRSIPSRLAPVLEALELDQPRVVTADSLAQLARDQRVDIDGVHLAYELRRLGWLVGLRTKGAMESAAVALGLAGRIPDREVLWVPPDNRAPKSFGNWRVIRLPVRDDGIASVDGLPTWRAETLLGGMARRPDGFHDWPNVGEWLARAVSQVDAESVARSLEGGPRAAWQRASYLLAMGGEEAAGFEVIEHAPIGRGPAYLGPRQRKGTFDRRFEVVDSVLAPSFSGVQP